MPPYFVVDITGPSLAFIAWAWGSGAFIGLALGRCFTIHELSRGIFIYKVIQQAHHAARRWRRELRVRG